MAKFKIMHEYIDDNRDADFSKAKLLLESAETIYFMWFGFNNLNVERLGITSVQPNKSVATAFGLKSREVDSIHRITNGKVIFEIHDCICLCRERVIWS